MTAAQAAAPVAGRAMPVDLPGLVSAVIGLGGMALPFVQFRANRIVAGDALGLPDALGAQGLAALAGIGVILGLAALGRARPALRLALGAAAALALTLALGAAASALGAQAGTLARISPGAGFWTLLLAAMLVAADGAARLEASPSRRWALLMATIAAVAAILWSGVLADVSVMREYAARTGQFRAEAGRHLVLAFASLGAALAVGLPLGVALHRRPGLRPAVLGVLDVLQTIPSLALFGVMIPLLGWVAAHVPGAAAAGVAGIGLFPALVALFLYSLLPVVSNTVVGLDAVPQSLREAAAGLGMTRGQVLGQVMIPLTLPVLLAAVRIVLVQNIGLAVIAGLIGGGGFGAFVFQGLNQTAMDLVLLGALPTIALALVAGVALDIAVAQLRAGGGR